ncbi:MAG TPA: hypothetical protein VJQ42_11415, partial [Rhodanobacteraceae bacterium]|nr:hypothetical protein [Rhodanobacteraceae bacterium]
MGISNATFRPCILVAMLALASVAGARSASSEGPSANWRDARQAILVTVPDWNATSGTLRTYERKHGAWREVGHAAPVVIGHAGAAWGIGLNPRQSDGPIKREGDGRSPAGVFAIGRAFGYAPDVATALDYTQMQSTSWCVDVSGS